MAARINITKAIISGMKKSIKLAFSPYLASLTCIGTICSLPFSSMVFCNASDSFRVTVFAMLVFLFSGLTVKFV